MKCFVNHDIKFINHVVCPDFFKQIPFGQAHLPVELFYIRLVTVKSEFTLTNPEH